LESARLAPSAANRQEWKFLVVKDQDTRDKLVEAANGQKFVGQAPITIVVCSKNLKESCPADSMLTQLIYPLQFLS
jgi:nitroreductase